MLTFSNLILLLVGMASLCSPAPVDQAPAVVDSLAQQAQTPAIQMPQAPPVAPAQPGQTMPAQTQTMPVTASQSGQPVPPQTQTMPATSSKTEGPAQTEPAMHMNTEHTTEMPASKTEGPAQTEPAMHMNTEHKTEMPAHGMTEAMSTEKPMIYDGEHMGMGTGMMMNHTYDGDMTNSMMGSEDYKVMHYLQSMLEAACNLTRHMGLDYASHLLEYKVKPHLGMVAKMLNKHLQGGMKYDPEHYLHEYLDTDLHLKMKMISLLKRLTENSDYIVSKMMPDMAHTMATHSEKMGLHGEVMDMKQKLADYYGKDAMQMVGEKIANWMGSMKKSD